MSKYIQLIWDFHGPDAAETAKHHAIHLKEYHQNNNIDYDEIGTELIGKEHILAFCAVKEEDMISVRDQLKPHRGVWWKPE